MSESRVVRTGLMMAMVLLGTVGVLGAPNGGPPAGMGKYVIVLWEPGTPVPGHPERKMKRVEEPDVEKRGGRLIERKNNLRLVYLPYAAARQLARHEAVASIQPLWSGERGEEWQEMVEQTHEGRLEGKADAGTLTWGPKAYEYDDSGNITAMGGDSYVYDTAGRLIKAVVNGKSETYEYDAYGNLTKRTPSGMAEVRVAVDGATNRVQGAAYDGAGNMTGSGRRVYEYDSLNMLSHVIAPQWRRMLYDPSDERIGTLIDDSLGRWTLRDFDGQILRELKSGNFDLNEVWIWELDHIRGEGQLIGGESQRWSYNEPGGEQDFGGMRHHHLDHLGSVRMVTDRAGRAVSMHDYLPYGSTLTATFQEQMNWADPHVDGMRYAGHWRDFLGQLGAESSEYVDNMHARTYDPGLGRFLSVDPALSSADPRFPQSWNRYTYAENNPILKVDPDGKQAAVPFPGAGPMAPVAPALYHAQQMQTNPTYRRAAIDAFRKLQAVGYGMLFLGIMAVSRPFLVTPSGTILPGGKDTNLVPTATGTDWLQIHDSHPHDGAQPHTHRPETHVGPNGEIDVNRTDKPTTAEDIDEADRRVKDNELRPRTDRNDKGDRPKSEPKKTEQQKEE